MTKEQIRNLMNSRVLILDGATGTNLLQAGMPIGVCPEQWILEHPQIMIDLQASYIEAGTHIVYAPTFTANRIKLGEYGLADRIEEMNKELVAISKRAVLKAGSRGYVAGDITMTGRQLVPMGDMELEALIDVYKEQIGYLVEAGVDLLVVETMMSLAEARAAVIAAKETCDLPIFVTLTFNEDGRTLFGTDPITAVNVLQSLGVDAIGANCSTGPEEMCQVIAEMKRYANVPIIAKPNAGMPELVNGETIYAMTPEEFAEAGQQLIEAGAGIIGGCCGTTPKHIMALAREVKRMEPPEINPQRYRLLSSERRTIELALHGPFQVVGERINPTGKKKLQEELRRGSLELVLEMAEEQEEQGAVILDINMGMNGIDEKEMMLKTVQAVSNAVSLPLCIDSSHVDIIEAALRNYPGRALINSISFEHPKVDELLPIAKKYGAMFILLPLSDKGLPESMEEKHEIIHGVLNQAWGLGFCKEDIVVDGLVATVGANKNAALETLQTIAYCKNELQLATICGLSNISFGLPERINVNAAFLTMAIANGLTMAIANPSQAMLMNAAFASDLLLNKEEADVRYIERMNTHATSVVVTTANKSSGNGETVSRPPVYEAVMKGNKDRIIERVEAELQQGTAPAAIIDTVLIPAINEVGDLFNKKIYFLPQLIASAEAMELAIQYLEPRLEKKNTGEKMPTIVIATVEGDIHDIGKNLVALMLRNYGYRVLDLGKDVPKEEIVETAVKEGASIIALSALMTTTMMRMKDVVEYAKKKKVKAKVMIGGAVITQSFADEIGADGYSRDAAEAVKVAGRLTGRE
ncbi:MAG: homocysteine S-methyltransferase family protein [Bacteroides sp.]|nr:homocysteine S-methyltransferase family protein [Bacteroides sp.]MCM1549487.1 homocysteine S-methyltransferase family protein [Clostridium sp.]